MNQKYEQLRAKAFSALQQLAAADPDFDQARMLIGSAQSEASLKQRTVRKSIDTEWIERVEAALPSLDVIIRNPRVFIEDEEEIVPVELTRRISEKSIKHLAQHTNLILEIKGDEVTPSRILNVFHEESYLTYENKFINTLLVRLSAFVDKRYRALVGGSGVEKDYAFEYGVDFEHFTEEEKRNSAKVKLQIELTSPIESAENQTDADLNVQYADAIERIRRINQAITTYLSSPFAQKLGRNFIRPPVIRTNAILKNKDFKECLSLWEYVEGYEKTGFSVLGEEYAAMPSDDYVSDLYGLLALQYTQFYHGVVGEETKLLAQRQMPEVLPEFERDVIEEELDDYLVYDSEYKKVVPVSRLMNNRKKLSEDERRIREAIDVALRADEVLNAELLRAEEEERRLERERREAEERQRAQRAAMEAAARRGPIEVRYKRSFLSRYIQCGEELQGRYTAIKNELLAFQRVSARVSWKCETYKQGKQPLARINVMGKSLMLYLALSPAAYEGKQFIANAEGKMPDTPLLIKVRSERSCKRALALIREMMQQNGAIPITREPEDYRMPFEDTEALVERGLIKRILPAGVTVNEYDELIRADIPLLIGDRKNADPVWPILEESPETVSENEETAYTEGEETAAPVMEGEPMPLYEEEAEEVVWPEVPGEYLTSFLARYIQSDPHVQERYTVLKNELLSYKRVSARTSWTYETYKQDKRVLARVDVCGRMLYVCLASPDATDKGQSAGESARRSVETPLLLKIGDEETLQNALEQIRNMMRSFGEERIRRVPRSFRVPFMSREELLERGLIRINVPQETEEDLAAQTSDEFLVQTEESAQTVSENGDIAPPKPSDDTLSAPDAPLAVWESVEPTLIDLLQIDFKDAEMIHEVTPAMVDQLGVLLQAVVVERMRLVDRVCVRLALREIPKEARKRMHVHPKNLIFDGERSTVGVPIPYTRQEYAAFSSRAKREALALAARMQVYHDDQCRLALLRVLKSADPKLIDKMKKLEDGLDRLRHELH